MSDDTKSRLKEKVRALPHVPGVYLMKDRLGQIIYVGKAKDLKKRVSTYFQPSRKLAVQQPKVKSMLPLITDFDIIEVKSDTEALILEGKLIKEWKPKYNTDFVDDKRFLLVRLDGYQPLPAFRLTRNRIDSKSTYYGPFVHPVLLRKTLAEMRRTFGILLGDAKPREISPGVWRLYDDVRREIYGHENEVTVESYRERVSKACDFLEGRAREWISQMEAQMLAHAEKHAFEKAAELRDLITAMRATLERTRKFTRNVPIVATSEDTLGHLRACLDLKSPPERMECFDISHVSGSFVVASMVCFRNGKPSKADYRRYHIKSFVGNDDFRAMEEVVGRRYQRLADEGRPFPDLVVIDGGKGQVGAALRAFLVLNLEPPPLIGLAKKRETIIFPDQRPPLSLPLNDPAIQLLQRIRDEAHRFANSFNADLRSRKIRESILDEFPGMGESRRAALMKHFRSITRLRKASVEEIQQVEGFGPVLAAALHRFLGGLPSEPDNQSTADQAY